MKKSIIFSGILIPGIIYIIFAVIRFSGVWVHTQDTKNFECTFTETYLPGPEDMQKINSEIAIISSAERIQNMIPPSGIYKNKNTIFGKLAIFNYKSLETKIVKIDNYPNGKGFQPHGMYYEESSQKLFVINHPVDGISDYIEQFQLDLSDITNIKIKHMHSILIDPMFTGMFNDLIKIAYGEFIITSWSISPQPIDGYLDDVNKVHFENFVGNMMDKKKTFLYHCKFNQTSGKPKKGLDCSLIPNTGDNMNNGINWDRKNKVVVANTYEKTVSIYKLDTDSNEDKDIQNSLPKLEKLDTVVVNGHPDNIDFDIYHKKFYVTGYLRQHEIFRYILGLSVEQKYAQHNENSKERDCGMFIDELDIIKQKNLNHQIVHKNVFQSQNAIGGASVALKFYNDWLIGSWFDKSTVLCRKEQ